MASQKRHDSGSSINLIHTLANYCSGEPDPNPPTPPPQKKNKKKVIPKGSQKQNPSPNSPSIHTGLRNPELVDPGRNPIPESIQATQRNMLNPELNCPVPCPSSPIPRRSREALRTKKFGIRGLEGFGLLVLGSGTCSDFCTKAFKKFSQGLGLRTWV